MIPSEPDVAGFAKGPSDPQRAEQSRVALFEQAPDGILIADPDGRYIDVNPAACRMLGYEREQLLGKRAFNLIAPEDMERGEIQRSRLLRGESVLGEWRLRKASGDWLPVEVNAKQLTDGRSQNFVRDVSRRKQAEEALAASEEKLRQMVALSARLLEQERLLNELGGVLASSLDAEQTLGEVSRRVTHYFADFCLVDLVQEGMPRRLHVTAREPARAGLAEALRDFPLERHAPRLEDVIWRTRQPELVEVTSKYLLRHSQGEEHLALLRALQARSIMGAPMVSRGTMTGLLIAVSCQRVYDEQDLRLLVQISERAAMAIENASLHSALQRANEEAHTRLTDLQEAHDRIQTLTGLLPVCAWCGRIRDEDQGGTWKRFDQYVSDHNAGEVSHGICPDCRTENGLSAIID